MAETERRCPHDDMVMKQHPLDTESAPVAAASGDGFGGKAPDSLKGEQVFAYDESRKLGVTSSVFLILNKMIGTGSECHPWWIRSEQCLTDIHAVFSTPSGIFRATGNVGISIILWIIGGIITFSGLSVYVHPLSQLLVF